MIYVGLESDANDDMPPPRPKQCPLSRSGCSHCFSGTHGERVGSGQEASAISDGFTQRE